MQSVMRTVFGIVAAVLALGLVVFGVQNTQLVEIRFLGFSTGRLSLSLVVIAAAIVGATIIWLVGLWSAAQRSIRQLRENRQRVGVEARNKELEKKLGQLEGELAQLRKPAAEPAAPAAEPAAKAAGAPPQ